MILDANDAGDARGDRQQRPHNGPEETAEDYPTSINKYKQDGVTV
jgi:hypothetical protein